MALFIKSRETDGKRKYWQDQIKRYKRSGLSQRQYCKTNGLCLSTLRKWKQNIKGPTKKNIPFVEIIPGSPRVDNGAEIEVEITGEVKLRAGEDIDPERLALIVNALKRKA